jgi:hypothetical protein
MVDQRVGAWAFILGILIAIIAGIATAVNIALGGVITLLLVILGLIVGFLNISDKEVQKFLIAAIALMAVGTANLGAINTAVPVLGTALVYVVQFIGAFVAPAALVIALKAVYNLARKPA